MCDGAVDVCAWCVTVPNVCARACHAALSAKERFLARKRAKQGA